MARSLRFDNQGLVYWSSLTDLYKGIKFIRRYKWWTVKANITNIDKLLETYPLIIETRVGWIRRQSHFVVIWEKKNGRYIMSDPLSTSTDFEKQYGSPSRWIYGAVLYEAKRKDPVTTLKYNIKVLIDVIVGYQIKMDDSMAKIEEMVQ